MISSQIPDGADLAQASCDQAIGNACKLKVGCVTQLIAGVNPCDDSGSLCDALHDELDKVLPPAIGVNCQDLYQSG